MTPLYEYKCNRCEHTIELRLSYSKSNLMPLCPACTEELGGAFFMEKQMGSAAAIRWKGGYTPPGGRKHQDG